MSQPARPIPNTALVLTGGGARAAYQVGVLLAVSKLSSNRRRNPFPILCAKGATCSAFDGEVPLFFDSDHLTGPGNMRLYDNFSRCMVAVVADRGCGN